MMRASEMLHDFSSRSLTKAMRLANTPEAVSPDMAVYPQLWLVQGSEGVAKYRVSVVGGPTDWEGLSTYDIAGLTCNCPNGKNTPLGRPQCYHAAAVLLVMERQRREYAAS